MGSLVVSQGARTVAVVTVTEHLRPGQLEYELAKVEARRDPPVPVTVWLLLDGAWHDAELLGWARNPNGSSGALMGLVFLVREYAPGFEAELLTWAPVENIRLR